MSVEDLNTADMFPDTIYLCRFDALNSVAVYSLRVPNRVQASSQCHVHWCLVVKYSIIFIIIIIIVITVFLFRLLLHLLLYLFRPLFAW